MNRKRLRSHSILQYSSITVNQVYIYIINQVYIYFINNKELWTSQKAH